jgi:hypothetical protein
VTEPRWFAVIGGFDGHRRFRSRGETIDGRGEPILSVECECGWYGDKCNLAGHVNLCRRLLAQVLR